MLLGSVRAPQNDIPELLAVVDLRCGTQAARKPLKLEDTETEIDFLEPHDPLRSFPLFSP